MLGFEWLIIIIIIDGGGDCLFCLCSDFSSEYSGSILSTKKKKSCYRVGDSVGQSWRSHALKAV